MNHNDKYKTQSLSLASAIQAVSLAKLESIERSLSSSKVTFVFDPGNDPNFHRIVSDFYSRNLPIDAATFFDSIKLVKSRLYQND